MNKMIPPGSYEWPLPDDPVERLVADALDAGRNARPGWIHRRDGWTPQRIGTFLLALAQTGGVAEAARAAGMSVRSAYALRTKAKGQAFDLAWQAALADARRRAADRFAAQRRSRHVKPIIRNGKLWGERHREDNRFAMSTLRRLDRLTALTPHDDPAVQFAAADFDAFVDFVCAASGSAPDFIAGDHSSSESPRARQLHELHRSENGENASIS